MTLKNAILEDFERPFFLWRGCAWSEISVWVILDILGEKSFLPTQSCVAPPQPSGSRFLSPRIEKSHFFTFWIGNLSFRSYFGRPPGRSPAAGNFFQHQIDQNIPIWGAHQKIDNIWPPKSSIPNQPLSLGFRNCNISVSETKGPYYIPFLLTPTPGSVWNLFVEL